MTDEKIVSFRTRKPLEPAKPTQEPAGPLPARVCPDTVEILEESLADAKAGRAVSVMICGIDPTTQRHFNSFSGMRGSYHFLAFAAFLEMVRHEFLDQAMQSAAEEEASEMPPQDKL